MSHDFLEGVPFFSLGGALLLSRPSNASMRSSSAAAQAGGGRACKHEPQDLVLSLFDVFLTRSQRSGPAPTMSVPWPHL